MRIRRKGWMAIAAAAVSALVWLHPGVHTAPWCRQSTSRSRTAAIVFPQQMQVIDQIAVVRLRPRLWQR